MALPLVIALGGSVAFGFGLSSPATQNYAAVFSRSIHGRLRNLAVPGSQCEDVIDNQIPRMPPRAAIVILDCGTNDIGGFGYTPDGKPDGTRRTAPANDAELAAAERQFRKALALIRRAEPAARVYVLNLRAWQRMNGAQAPQFARDVKQWNAMVTASGLRVVDLNGDSRMYRAAYIQRDLVHPNARGSAAIAEDFSGLRLTPRRPRRRSTTSSSRPAGTNG